MEKAFEVIIRLASTNAVNALIVLGAVFIVYVNLRKDFEEQKQEIVDSKNQVIESKNQLIQDLENRLRVKMDTTEDILKAKEISYEIEIKKLEEVQKVLQVRADASVGENRQKLQEALQQLQTRGDETRQLKVTAVKLKVENQRLKNEIFDLQQQEDKAREDRARGVLGSGLVPERKAALAVLLEDLAKGTNIFPGS